jgi:hypothetical protein
LTAYGLDVEIIEPAQDTSQANLLYVNGVGQVPTTCNGSTYPQQVLSTLNGQCYASTTIVLRARLPIAQSFGPAQVIVRTIVVRAGTDA